MWAKAARQTYLLVTDKEQRVKAKNEKFSISF